MLIIQIQEFSLAWASLIHLPVKIWDYFILYKNPLNFQMMQTIMFRSESSDCSHQWCHYLEVKLTFIRDTTYDNRNDNDRHTESTKNI